MTSFLAELIRRDVFRVAVAYAIVGLLIIALAFIIVDNYVLDAPRPPFAGAEVDPASLGPEPDEPPVPAAVRPAPTIAEEIENDAGYSRNGLAPQESQ